jgi:hypothetical protein
LEPSGKERGLFNYVWDQVMKKNIIFALMQSSIHFLQQADFLIQDVVQTCQRNKLIDVTFPWIFGSFSLLMPVQDDTANFNSVIKPFQWPVSSKVNILTIKKIRRDNIV